MYCLYLFVFYINPVILVFLINLEFSVVIIILVLFKIIIWQSNKISDKKIFYFAKSIKLKLYLGILANNIIIRIF